RRARLQVHLHHALRLPRGDVRHLERDGGAGPRSGAGAVDAREGQGGPSDREPPRDGTGRALPGAREEVHPGHRGSDQVVGRLRPPPHALIEDPGGAPRFPRVQEDAMSVQSFYDELASLYHLVYEDWENAVARQGAALSSLMAENWPDARAVLDASVGIGTQA